MLPASKDKTAHVHAMFDRIAPRYDRLNRLISLGNDRLWRRRAVDSLRLSPNSLILDVACGTGDFLRLLSDHQVVGVDLSLPMLQRAKSSRVLQADVEALPFRDHTFDALTCGFALRNFTNLDAALAEMARVAQPGAPVAFLDASRPRNPLVRLGHGVYFGKIVPRIGRLLSDEAAYAYLPESLSYLPHSDELRDRMRTAGFGEIVFRTYLFGAVTLITARVR